MNQKFIKDNRNKQKTSERNETEPDETRKETERGIK